MQIGDILNQRYTLTAHLGRGAMGEVFQATDAATGQPVAIKVLDHHLTLQPDLLERFKREGEALRQLRHRHIVSFVDTFQHAGQQVIVMEYVSGGSLHELIKRGPLPVEQVRQIAIDLCDALTTAHRLNIIHRDIKPENVLMTEDGTSKLTDFGVARLVNEGTRLTGTGMQIGTPFYMSPEAWQGQPLDARADIWSLGVMLCEMLTGEVPFGGDTLIAVMNKVLTAPLPDLKKLRPETPQALIKIVRRMLERDPAKRYQSLREAGWDLERAAAAPTSAAAPQAPVSAAPRKLPETRPPAKNNWKRLIWVVGGLGLVFGVCLLAAGGGALAMRMLPQLMLAGQATPAPPTGQAPAATVTQTAPAATLPPTPLPGPTQATATPIQPTAAPAGQEPAGQELADAFAGKLKGTKVTVFGSFADVEQVRFLNSVKDFEDKTGIDIQYESSQEFDAAISIRVNAGNPPDVVDFPQPGLLGTFAKSGKVLDLNRVISTDWLKKNYLQSWLDMATMPGPNGPIMAGIWSRVNTKSLVWYPKAEFDKAGYTAPTTWDELMAITDQISKDGGTPWCIGIESGGATGWPMTDWIEEAMLRTTSLENYDRWVAGTLKFDSPEVRKAIDVVTKIWFTDKYVYGGRKGIVTTGFGDAPKPMFEKPPKCWLHKQGSFITAFFPAGLKAGVDYDFFYLPPIDLQYGKPVEIPGDIYAAFNDRPEVRAVMQYFSTGDSIKVWVEAGGVVSPHRDSNLDWYRDPITRKVAETLQNVTSVRFDASDLMPPAVGASSFWKEMTAFVSGSIDEGTALKEIDASWPK